MIPSLGLLNVLSHIPTLLVHLVGVVVAVVLLVKRERPSAPAVLALTGFGLLVLLDALGFVRGPLIAFITQRTAVGVRLAASGVGCCCSGLDVVATACLIVALWKGLSQGDNLEGSLGDDEDQGV